MLLNMIIISEEGERKMENEQNISTEQEVPVVINFTATGRPTVVGTRTCKECGRPEYSTKKFEASGNPEDRNMRYTLCKGVCVYCYAQKRNKSTGSSLSIAQLEAKIKYYSDLLLVKAKSETE
jgi:sulfatase maturation enzyme AslB (radical SAM superfamily)